MRLYPHQGYSPATARTFSASASGTGRGLRPGRLGSPFLRAYHTERATPSASSTRLRRICGVC